MRGLEQAQASRLAGTRVMLYNQSALAGMTFVVEITLGTGNMTMGKKIVPLILVIVGAALTLGALISWSDTLTAAEPAGLGKWIFDVLGLLLGAGAGLKGLLDLFKKEKPPEPATRITAPDETQIATGANGRNIRQGDGSTYFERVDHYHEAPLTQPEAHPALGSIPPASADTYVHRGRIEEDIRAALRGGGASAIVGLHAPGGTGKTELANHIAQEGRDGQLGFESVLWLDVNKKTAQEVLSEGLRKCGLQLPPNADEADQRAEWQHFLLNHKLLVIFDDVRENAREGLKAILPPAPSAALITSRIQQMAGVKEFALDHMEPEQARALFVNSLGAEVVQAEDETVFKLAERCKYNPLALEIASRRIQQNARFTTHPVAKYFEKAEKRFDELKMHGDERWNLTAVFDISYNDLTEADQRYFRALAVFAPTGFAPPAAAQVWEMAAGQASEVLSRFINLSLVIPVKGNFERYRLHDLLDEYATPKLRQHKEEENTEMRLANWLINLFTEHFTADFSSAPEAGLEFANLARTAKWAIENRQGALLAALATQPRNWLFIYFREWSDWLRWLESSLKIDFEDKQLKANVLQAIGDVQQFRDDRDAALESYTEALRLFKAVGDKLGEANVLAALSLVAIGEGRLEEAEDQLEQIIQMRRAIHNLYNEGADYGNFAIALLQAGYKEKAKGYAEKARLIFEKIKIPTSVQMIERVIAACEAQE